MIDTLNTWANGWFQWQWAMLWQTAVLIVLVAVVDKLIRKWAWPQLRYALWLLILVKLIMPPSLSSPASITSYLPTLTHKVMHREIGHSQQETKEQGISSVVSEPIVKSDSSPDDSLTSSAVPTAPSQKGIVTNDVLAQTRHPAGASSPSLDWKVGLLGLWLMGVVFFTSGLFLRYRRLCVDHKEHQSIPIPEWFEGLLEKTAAEICLRRIPRVILSRQVASPAVFGFFRPTLLMPGDRLDAMTESETRYVLLHELAHIKRYDLLGHGLYMVLLIVYWFNPLVWLIRKPIQQLRELCCDATVAQYLREDTSAYRQTLLETAKGLLGQAIRPSIGLLGLFEDTDSLETRLHWLEKKTWRHSRLRLCVITITAVTMLYCILPMASSQAVDTKDANRPFQITLSNGAIIELVGVCECPSAGKQWWRPDGTLLSEAPYDSGIDDLGTDDLSPGDGAYEVAVRYTRLPEGANGHINIKYASRWNGGHIPNSSIEENGLAVEGMTYIRAIIPKGTDDNMTVKVDVATGDWQTYVKHVPSPGGGWGSCAISGAMFVRPYDLDGQMHITITHDVGDRETRFIALDVNNVEHEALNGVGSGYALGVWQHTPRFDVSMEEVAAVYLQVRPYEQVAFRNVSLQPGLTKEVQIISLGSNEVENNHYNEDYWLGREKSVNRDHSKDLLRAFYLGLVRHLDKNEWKGLPHNITKLVFKSENNDYYYVGDWYVRHLGYFGDKGFHSIAPEQLKSDQVVPLVYCKKILELENQEVTNVLFSDGHVEWITAQRLEELKAEH